MVPIQDKLINIENYVKQIVTHVDIQGRLKAKVTTTEQQTKIETREDAILNIQTSVSPVNKKDMFFSL